MNIEVKELSPTEWAEISEIARLKSFGDHRPPSMDRIDFALLVVDELEHPVGYATCSAINAEVVHLKMLGGFPNDTGFMSMAAGYLAVHGRLVEKGFKHVRTHIRADNVKVLRFSMTQGYRICGYTNFAGEPLVELHLVLKKE